jgi:rhodanese-related sulfurtransferase
MITKGHDMRSVRFAVFFLLLCTALFARPASAGEDSTLITPSDAARIIAEDSTAVLLDVRTEPEFMGEAGHLANAIMIPVQVLTQRVGELAPYKNRIIVVYCRTGHRSTAATAILRQSGFKAYNMAGGITRWRQEGRPIVRE